MVSVSVQSALAATLVDDGTCLLDAADGPAPLSVDVWLNSRASTGTLPLEEAAPEETSQLQVRFPLEEAAPGTLPAGRSSAALAPSQPADLGAADAAAVARE